ncbi:MAG: hypothetical protein EOP52_07100 [Sphingobacteriales bacterium]|nr:MAG: hypothetical protein EOP52_07100 [Sphingobacteriales bacterium]
MAAFVSQHEHDSQISVYFNIEAPDVLAVGQQMEAIAPQAYMNGYNWDAFLTHYLRTQHPSLLSGLETDSEAGTYVALYKKTNALKAAQLVEIIQDLISQPDKIYVFLEAEANDIEWD